jgi:hypothetical protein
MKLRHTVFGQTFGGALVVFCLSTPSIPALGQNAPAAAPANAERPNPEQHVASIKTAKARQDDYLNGLAAAVQNEKRDDAWARRTEGDLRNSYASAKLAAGGLKSVDCRAMKCDVQVQLQATKSVAAAVNQQSAVVQWISSGTPCSYTMVPSQAPTANTASVTRIYLTCGR